MAKQTKKEKFIQAFSEAVSSRSPQETQNAMNEMLWVLAEGTRYQIDVEEAFEHLEELKKLYDNRRDSFEKDFKE